MKSIAMSAVLAALFAGTVAVPAVAADRERGINARQGMQQSRIQQGVRHGDLTRGETHRLRGEARNIRRDERAFRSDGNLSRGERRHLDRDLNRMSRDIRHQRNDGQRRFGHRSADQRFAFRGRGHAYGRNGGDRRFWARGSDHRFARHNGHPRFGNQWGHRSPASGVNRMQAQQHRRIVQGIRSGELTPREARRLQGEQRVIRRQERAYLADGHLSRSERRDLYGDLRDANRHIYNQTHDAQARR
jgi:hypothetical protein